MATQYSDDGTHETGTGDAGDARVGAVACRGGATTLVGRTGRSLDGTPLAHGIQPEPALLPWFSWLAGTHADMPEGFVLSGSMLSDQACIRVVFGGTWTAHTADGVQVFEAGEAGLPLYCGPQSRVMPVSVEGTLKVVSIYLGIGGSMALGCPAQRDMIDRVANYDTLVGRGQFASLFDMTASPKAWNASSTRELRRFLGEHPPPAPDPVVLDFEARSLADPAFMLQDFAAAHGVSIRTVERLVRRYYGLTPKQVLRRARALDLAAALMGVAMSEEEAAMRLRYFDQSHQIREIREFFDRTPRQLRDGRDPLLLLNLEIRQSRRIAALARLQPDTIRPWRDPSAEL